MNHIASSHTSSIRSWTRIMKHYSPAHLLCLTLVTCSMLMSACTPAATPPPTATQPPAATATSAPQALPPALPVVLKLEAPGAPRR